jgi:hypothetical protein
MPPVRVGGSFVPYSQSNFVDSYGLPAQATPADVAEALAIQEVVTKILGEPLGAYKRRASHDASADYLFVRMFAGSGRSSPRSTRFTTSVSIA